MSVLVVAGFYLLLFVAVEVIAKKSKLPAETSRKFIHIFAGVTAGLLPLVLSFSQIAFLALLFSVVMLVSKRQNFFRSIHGVQRSTYGEVYFPLAILFCALLFPARPAYMYGLFVMALSDGLASIAGQAFGKRKYTVGAAQKSYMGSGVFFATAFLIGIFLLRYAGLPAPEVFVLAPVLAALLTLLEAVLSYGLDNLLLPIAAAALLQITVSIVR